MPAGRCLVLGGGGFLGSHVAERLVREGYAVRVFDCFPRGPLNLAGFEREIEVIEGNFGDHGQVEQALEGVDHVFHFLGTTLPQTSNEDPVRDIETNVVATVRMLESAVQKGVKRVVFASSGGTVYGIPEIIPIPESHPTNPVCSYGIGKLAIEKYLQLFQRLYGLRCLILRYANPYGERQNPYGAQGAAAVFLHKVVCEEPVEIWGDGEVIRDFIYVGDAVEATMRTFHTPGLDGVYNCGSGTGASVNELLQAIADVSSIEPRIVRLPARAVDTPCNILDIRCISGATGWLPDTSLHEGLERTWQWMKENSAGELCEETL